MKRKFTRDSKDDLDSAKTAKCGSTVDADSTKDEEPYLKSWFSIIMEALKDMPIWFKIFIITSFVVTVIFLVLAKTLHWIK